MPPLVRRCPRSSVSSTGAFSHILMRCSIFLSLMRRATHCISSKCGILSKYRERSASTISVRPSSIALWTVRTASSALRLGRYPKAASSKSASKIGSSTNVAAVSTTLSRIVGTVVSNCTSHSASLGSRFHVHRRPHPLTAGLFNTGGKGHIQAAAVIAARRQLALFNPIVDRTVAGSETSRHSGDGQLSRSTSRC